METHHRNPETQKWQIEHISNLGIQKIKKIHRSITENPEILRIEIEEEETRSPSNQTANPVSSFLSGMLLPFSNWAPRESQPLI